MNKLRLVSITLLVAVMSVVMLLPLSAGTVSAKSAAGTGSSSFTNIPVTGKFPGNGKFNGTLTVTQFAQQGSNVVANGVLNGTLTNKAGQTVGTVTNKAVTLPVTFNHVSSAAITQQASCSILNLMLGPLDLNLLGLMVHLNQVVLTITAQSGPGNLLGNLLCDVANLLNNGGPLSTLVSDLNQILTIVG